MRSEMGPLVSVVIPTFNRPKFLKKCVESVLSQTYREFEVLVINDGGEEVEQLVTYLGNHATLRHLSHDTNRGPGAAKNTGIRAARGKYIAYLDDDDIYYPEHLETLVGALEGTDYKVAYSDAHRLELQKKEGEYEVVKISVPYSNDLDRERLLSENLFPILVFMHERSCFDVVGLFDESLPALEDWDMWIKLSRVYDFLHIKKVTCAFTWRSDGSTLSSSIAHKFAATRPIIEGRYKK